MPILATATKDIKKQMMIDLDDFFKTADIDDIENFLTTYISELDKNQYSKKIELINVFNNLMCNMPNGVYRKNSFMSLDKQCAGSNIVVSIESGHSKQRASGTLQDFFDVIDQTISECGFTVEGIKTDSEYAPDQTTFYEIIRPIYIALRKKGYTHIDLIT